jgi:hypothetical protein
MVLKMKLKLGGPLAKFRFLNHIVVLESEKVHFVGPELEPMEMKDRARGK